MVHKKLSLLAALATMLCAPQPTLAGEKKKQERKAQKQLARDQRETYCYDNDNFTDEKGHKCDYWTYTDCGEGATTMGYSSRGEIDLLQNCCRTCFLIKKDLTPSPSFTPAPTPVGWTPSPTMFWLSPSYPYLGDTDQSQCPGLKRKHCKGKNECIWNKKHLTCNHIDTYTHVEAYTEKMYRSVCKKLIDENTCQALGCKWKSVKVKCVFKTPKCKKMKSTYICAHLPGCYLDHKGRCKGTVSW